MELFEREAQLDILDSALAEISAGTGRIALISGEAGIGKTSLVKQFTLPHRDAVRVFWGFCDSLYTPRPFSPIHDIALQAGGKLLESFQAGGDRATIFSETLATLQERTTIVIIEDVHWADQASLDVLRYICRRIVQTSTLMILVYRDDELSPQHSLRTLLGELAVTSQAIRIALRPLSVQAIRKMIGERAINASDLHRSTGGNPFFVTEVLASPVSGIPETVRDAVLARTARLSLSGWAVLEAAAVIGQRVEAWLLAEVTGAEASAAQECIDCGMLTSDGDALVFRHELARQTILETLSPPRTHILNRIVLDSLKTAPATRDNLARLAHHAEATGDGEAVLAYAPTAARQAAEAGAHRDAATLYELALQYGNQLPPEELAELLDAYSRECNLTERQTAAIAARKQALSIWQDLGDMLKQGEILASLPIMLRNNGDNAEAERMSQRAIEMLEALPPGRELALAYRVQATLRLSNRDYQEAIRWGELAVELAERYDSQNLLPMAHIAVGSAYLFLDYQSGCDYLEKWLEIVRTAGQERQIANLLAYLGSASVEVFQLENAVRYLNEGIRYTADRSLDIFYRYYQAWLALAYFHQGRWSEAQEISRQLMDRENYPAISRITALVVSGLLQVCQGQPEADSALDEALKLAVGTGTLQYLGLVGAARAEAAWLDGDRRGVLDEANAVYELAESKTHPWFAGIFALWRRKAGDRFTPPEWVASPFALQLAGDWQAAADEWARLGCPYYMARALQDGDISAKRTALNIFEQLNARPAADALRQDLHGAGAAKIPNKPHASTRGNPFGLTNRQVEILTYLVADSSNAEIADRLHVTPKTVDHHVSAVLSRLNVHTRTEAAALARTNPYFQKK